MPGAKGGAREEDGSEVEDDEPAHGLLGKRVENTNPICPGCQAEKNIALAYPVIARIHRAVRPVRRQPNPK